MTSRSIRALTSALRRAKGPAAADVDVRDCVDAERLAAWSAGALSADEAADVERHLATCVRCQDVAAVFAETVEPAAAALPATVQAPVSGDLAQVDGAAGSRRRGRRLAGVAPSESTGRAGGNDGPSAAARRDSAAAVSGAGPDCRAVCASTGTSGANDAGRRGLRQVCP